MRQVALVAGALVLAFSAPQASQDKRQPNVIVISLDTTRADALSCYGTPPGIERELPPVTPTLDELAAKGTRFANAWSHAPTTLSSHTSLFTGEDQHSHAVVRNGFPLEPGHATLAQRMKDHGYDTLAVVGAAALEKAMGLTVGFRLYDDELASRFGPMVQDRADRVVDRTLTTLDARDETKPLFLFTHFYDAHAPYDAPGEAKYAFVDPAYDGPMREDLYRIRPVKQALADGEADPATLDAVASRYLGEVAFVDGQIARLFEALEQRGLLEDALVVVTADHGEMLHEQPLFAYSHGHDVFAGAMRIPMIVWASHGLPRGRVVHRQVELSGLAPTIEDLLGWTPSLGHKRTFSELLALGPVNDTEGWPDRPVRTVFTEATRAVTDHPEWNNLGLMRGVHAGGFELRAWPNQGWEPKLVLPRSQIEALEPVRPILVGLLERWDSAAPPHREETMSEATREALKALGYLEED